MPERTLSWGAMVGRRPAADRRGRAAGVRGEAPAVRYRRRVAYAVSTPVFEGPIDLLLHLVSVHEVDVLDIPLLPVVDAFVRVLAEQRGRRSTSTSSPSSCWSRPS